MSGRPLLGLGLGFGIWAIGFVALYAAQGTGCALGWDAVRVGPASLLRVVLIVLSLATLAAAFVVQRRLHATPPATGGLLDARSFLASVSAQCACYALPAVGLTFSGVTVLSPCL